MKYFILCIGISFLLFCISFFFIYQRPGEEKLSVYECGFNPFEDSRMRFEVRYYIVTILFLVFDLEIVFLALWSITLNKLCLYGYIVGFLFIFILLIGFFYEWYKGALIWE